MKFKHLFLSCFAIVALSCSVDEQENLKSETATISSTTDLLNKNNQNLENDYKKLLKDLYGASNYKVGSFNDYNENGRVYKIAIVSNKQNNALIYGYIMEDLSDSKSYFFAHNEIDGVITAYSTTSFENYSETTYSVKNEIFYIANGFSPDNSSKADGSWKFFGCEDYWGAVGYNPSTNQCFQGSYSRCYVFGVKVSDSPNYDINNHQITQVVPCN